jgi:exodeoxyribonuclease V alpha subunit
MPDLNSNTVSGVVEEVVFHNSVSGFTVLEINCAGELVSAVGVVSEIAAGEEVKLQGKWVSHEVFGRQFKFDACRRSLPDTAAKLFRYLASGAVKGVGPKLAAKIIERFGEESFDVLENDPERLAVINGISKDKARKISDEFRRLTSLRQVLLELENYGVTPTESTTIYKYFGVNAVNVIKENPYILFGTINGFTFERSELIAEAMGLPPDSAYRRRAGIIYVVTHNLSNGHTCIPRRKLVPPCCDRLDMTEEETNNTIDELIDSKQLVSDTVSGEEFIFLPRLYIAEKQIAEKLALMTKFAPSAISTIESDIDTIEAVTGVHYAGKQREALKTAGEKGMLVLTGGPGTGKTTAVKGIIEVFKKKHVDVLLCAPTGRAAKRLSEVCGQEAKTIHRLLEVEWDDTEKPTFNRNAENPLRCGALIVDEMSMVDAELFASLLDALPLGARLILVGDSDQLPSVGPGNVLTDIIGSECIPVVCLTEIFRQAQKSLVVMNAHRIITGEMPELTKTDSDFFFMKRDNSQTPQTVAQLLAKRLPDAYGFDPFTDIQVLCPSRKGDSGTVNLNRLLQSSLNPKHKTKNEVTTTGGKLFREGDRVMQVKNNYRLEWHRGAEEGEGIFNGDIGILKKINYAAGTMTIEFDDRTADYPTDNLSELELAYAVTVHKSQGSEYPAVILPLSGVQPMLLYRNLLYTAVTRAKKMLVIVGNEEIIFRMVQNNRQNKRYSALKEFLTQ